MVIHTKEKAKIHTHNPKQAKIKGSNIYTVERGPKTIKASVEKVKATDAKNRNVRCRTAGIHVFRWIFPLYRNNKQMKTA